MNVKIEKNRRILVAATRLDTEVMQTNDYFSCSTCGNVYEIPVAAAMKSQLTTSGATNSGVPHITLTYHTATVNKDSSIA